LNNTKFENILIDYTKSIYKNEKIEKNTRSMKFIENIINGNYLNNISFIQFNKIDVLPKESENNLILTRLIFDREKKLAENTNFN
jgi:hypothetical protein